MKVFSAITVALLGAAQLAGAAPTVESSSSTLHTLDRRAPSPVQPGTPKDCSAYHKVKAGDNCSKIANSAHISLNDFYSWNSGVNKKCSNLMKGYYVCTDHKGHKGTGGGEGGGEGGKDNDGKKQG